MFDKQAAIAYLLELLGQLTGKSSFAADTNLIDAGVLDSLTMMDLVAGIDAQYGVRLAVQDLTPQNFESINSIVEIVAAKVEGG